MRGATRGEQAAEASRALSNAERAAGRAVNGAGRQANLEPFPQSEPIWKPRAETAQRRARMPSDPTEEWIEATLERCTADIAPRPDWMPPPRYRPSKRIPRMSARLYVIVEAARRGILPADHPHTKSKLLNDLRRYGGWIPTAGMERRHYIQSHGHPPPFIIHIRGAVEGTPRQITLAASRRVELAALKLQELVRTHTAPTAVVQVRPFVMVAAFEGWIIGYEWLADVDDAFDAGLVEVEDDGRRQSF